MPEAIEINKDIIPWAINRAGLDVSEFLDKYPKYKKWIDGEKEPTFTQLEEFSKKVHVPFGFLFLETPPQEISPITFFRTTENSTNKVSLNVYDTILMLQNRQEWLREYLIDNGYSKLSFVGKYINSSNKDNIVNDIRETLNLKANWAMYQESWQSALGYLVETIEDKGIIISFNGVVGNSPNRKISVDECRGFVLVDEYAPFMFINNADSKSAQIFTIMHEIAHIWIGKSAGFDFRKLQPSNDFTEKLCDTIAAEFLVPESILRLEIRESIDYKRLSKRFKVSEIVIARRLLDLQLITLPNFYNFYDSYINKEITKKEGQDGGNFYALARKRISLTFAYHVRNAVKSGQLLYRDAYKLIGLRGNTFESLYPK